MGRKKAAQAKPQKKVSLTELLTRAVENKGEQAVLDAVSFGGGDMDTLKTIAADPAAAGLEGTDPARLRNQLKKAAKVVNGNKYAHLAKAPQADDAPSVEEPQAIVDIPQAIPSAEEAWEQYEQGEFAHS